MAKAAGVLALTQPAVSKAMQEMEAELGVPLLERDARGVRPTVFGEAMAARARAMVDELGQGARDLAHLADPDVGEARIGTTEPMTFTVAEAIRQVARDRPRITFDVAISDTGSLLSDLRARRLDVVVTRYGFGAADEDLEAAWLFRVPLVAVADRRNPLLRRRALRLADVMEEPWTLSPPDTFLGRLVAAAFRREGLPLPPAAVTSVSIAMRLSLIVGGRCISMLPRTMLHHPTNAPWLRALDVTVEDSEGAIAALTLKRR
ncbi:LysR family transcriptional regulator [Roseicella aquatilis]|uniref:LysR family transcriptional regulator n=1 Tax=Roseicella aquatilis TaxID=2527868 RepID=A0A4R4DSX4_9PROT|nr:LysR family transcriptional regulator [Roseicella aquatilis]TCZ63866.1 LysR family transcriptional regulator [Roseicella aquatilis]